MMIVADKAIGRDDYGQPQCSFRKRSNSNKNKGGSCDPLPSLFGGWRQPRGPQSLVNEGKGPWWSRIFTTQSQRNKNRQHRLQNRRLSRNRQSRLRKRIGLAIRQGRDVTFTNDIALIKLRHRIQFSDRIHPVKLPPSDFNYIGYQCYVSGWGIQGPDQGPSPTLKGAELAVRANPLLSVQSYLNIFAQKYLHKCEDNYFILQNKYLRIYEKSFRAKILIAP